jgi:hypothetical protein
VKPQSRAAASRAGEVLPAGARNSGSIGWPAIAWKRSAGLRSCSQYWAAMRVVTGAPGSAVAFMRKPSGVSCSRTWWSQVWEPKAWPSAALAFHQGAHWSSRLLPPVWVGSLARKNVAFTCWRCSTSAATPMWPVSKVR